MIKKQNSVLSIVIFISFFYQNVHAQTKEQSVYNKFEAFAPFFYSSDGNDIRTASGRPGEHYWQNSVDYKIDVVLNDSKDVISGSEIIIYKNMSPESMSYLWMQLDQSANADKSRGRYDSSFKDCGGYTIKSISVIEGNKKRKLDYSIYGTRMRVELFRVLNAHGGLVRLKIDFSFNIYPVGNRSGILKTKQGKIYEIAQWYPRMCVFDDVHGWNSLPYIGYGEFYLEYGDIDFSINVPASHIIVASGKLQNPRDVLTPKQVERLARAAQCDKTTFIRTVEEVNDAAMHPKQGRHVWKFRCTNTRDAAWASSPAFVWDAARINLADGKNALAMSVYAPDVSGDSAWGRSTEMAKGCIEHYSQKWYPYTYPVAVNVGGSVSGMEYPGIVFCNAHQKDKGLWHVTSHEFGHNWFPMIAGSNERLNAWMDEGFNTFINQLADQGFNKGEFNTVISDQHARAGDWFHDTANAIIQHPDVGCVNLAYHKPAFGLQLLREEILGEERFDKAFRYYIKAWAFKHPTPWDFFRCIENNSGESLDWFWRGWFLNNWKVDIGVFDIRRADDTTHSLIGIECMEKLPMPVTVDVTDLNNNTKRFKFPIEIWQTGSKHYFEYPATPEMIKRVEVDPEKRLPDINNENNVWEQK